MMQKFHVKLHSTILAILFAISLVEVKANDIKVENVNLSDQTTGSHTLVNFDLSWKNSWKDNTNYDAAWVFVKYKIGSGEWLHATLSTTPTDHTAPSGSTITPSSDGKGVFIYRDGISTGDNNFDNVSLRWNYPSDLVANDAQVTVKVFAIEMVNIPQGSFYIGDGVSAKRFHPVGDTLSPFQITSENALTIDGTTPGTLWALGDMQLGDGLIPANYPKGYDAFYVMKYEITQGQYTEFLNMLTSNQATNRFNPLEMTGDRFTISGTYPNFTTNRPTRACNFLAYQDGAAYADWIGLRPISELEFEKAARGTATAVAGEYAWGNTNIDLTGDLSGSEDGTETVTGSLNCNHQVNFTGGDGGTGPIRSGIFATSLTNRESSGGSFYGVMELSGNVWETVITCGVQTSRSFNGSHGNGTLDVIGNADVGGWPTNAFGGRGGGWQNTQPRLRVSDRFYINSAALREPGNGFRCGRTAE